MTPTVQIRCEYFTTMNNYAIIKDIETVFGEFSKYLKAITSFDMSVCPSAWNNLAPTGRIFMKFGIRGFFSNIRRENPRFINV